MLLRDFEGELQVFMQQRAYEASFVGGAYVFPGGKVDEHDKHISNTCLCLPAGARKDALFQKPLAKSFAIAAIRECFEEAGILLAYNEANSMLSMDSEEEKAFWFRQRQALNDDQLNLAELCEQNRLQLALDQLVFFGHWITPESSPQRFDTLFFACAAPAFQEGDHDDYESIHSVWLSASEALEQYRRKQIQLITPTLKSLEHLEQFSDTQSFLEHHAQGRSVLGR